MKVPVSEAPAGLALDAAVAQLYAQSQGLDFESSVLGTYVWYERREAEESKDYEARCLFEPSGCITVAFKLVEELCTGSDTSLTFTLIRSNSYWKVGTVEHFAEFKVPRAGGQRWSTDHVEMAPLAITRAYLLAHGIEEIEVPDEAA